MIEMTYERVKEIGEKINMLEKERLLAHLGERWVYRNGKCIGVWRSPKIVTFEKLKKGED